MTQLILIRHAETQVNLDEAPNKWHLSKRGKLQAQLLIPAFLNRVQPDNVKSIWCSEEAKSFETIQPVAQALGMQPIALPHFNEIGSDQAPEPSSERFAAKKHRFFQHSFDQNFPPLRAALTQIETISVQLKGETGIICSHGTLLTMIAAHYAHHLTDPEWMFAHWNHIPFCGVAMLEDGTKFHPFQTIL
jgi:broad specificity phosphatase PhoE